MEDPADASEDKRVRWVARPSEAQLLEALRPPPLRAGTRPRPRPQHPAVAAPAVGPTQGHPGRRLHGRDVATIAAVASAAWFALQAAEHRLPFQDPGAVAPPAGTAEVAATRAAVDRRELLSLPRDRAGTAGTGPRPAATADGGLKAGQESSGSKEDQPPPSPPSGTSEPPLLQATVPGVGTVTVEDPDLLAQAQDLLGTDALGSDETAPESSPLILP